MHYGTGRARTPPRRRRATTTSARGAADPPPPRRQDCDGSSSARRQRRRRSNVRGGALPHSHPIGSGTSTDRRRSSSLLRILFLFSDTGGSYRASAEAVAHQLRRLQPEHAAVVVVHDLLDVWFESDCGWPYRTLKDTRRAVEMAGAVQRDQSDRVPEAVQRPTACTRTRSGCGGRWNRTIRTS